MDNPIVLQDTRPINERRPWLLSVIILAVVYACLYAQSWYAGAADDAYYLAIARSLATGDGFHWNGLPVLLIPPGWPMLLAGVMKISSNFALLNLIPPALTLIASGLWYPVIRRFASPKQSMAVTLISGTMFHWHRHAFHHYSEAIALCLTAGAILLAFQISENRPGRWRLPLLIMLCIAMVASRWAALMMVIVLAGALMNGHPLRPKPWNRQWTAVTLITLTIGGSYIGLRSTLKHMAQQQLAQTVAPDAREMTSQIINEDNQRITQGVGNISTYPRRIAVAGEWLSRLFWPPAEVGRAHPNLLIVSNIIGWCLIGLLTVYTGQTRHKQWFWLGIYLHCAAMVIIWWRPNPRYIVTLTPALLLGIWQGSSHLIRLTPSLSLKRIGHALIILLIASIIACNTAILAVNIWTVQSPRSTSLCLAGEFAELVAAANTINHQKKDNSLAVSTTTTTLGRRRSNSLAIRILHLLTNQNLRIAPPQWHPANAQEAPMLAEWMQQEDIHYILTRPIDPNAVPSRLWVLRTDWLEPNAPKASTHTESKRYFELYQRNDNGFIRLELTPPETGIAKIPGLP